MLEVPFVTETIAVLAHIRFDVRTKTVSWDVITFAQLYVTVYHKQFRQ